MDFVKKLLRVYAMWLATFATWHLGILLWYAITKGQWHVLQVGEIWDIRYLFPNYVATFWSEFVFSIIVAIVFVWVWRWDSRSKH